MAEDAEDTSASSSSSSMHAVRVRRADSEEVRELFFCTVPTANAAAERIFQDFHSGEENITAAQIQLTGPNGESYAGLRLLPDVELVYDVDKWSYVDSTMAFACMDAGSGNDEVREKLGFVVEYPLRAGKDVATPLFREVAEAAQAVCAPAPAPAANEVTETRMINMRGWNSHGTPYRMRIPCGGLAVQVEAQVFEELIPKPTEIKASDIIVFKDGQFREFPAPFRELIGDDFVYHVLTESLVLPFPESFRNRGLNELLQSVREATDLGFDDTPLWREVVLIMQAYMQAESVTAEDEGVMGDDDLVRDSSHLMETLMNIVKINKREIAEKGKPLTLRDLADKLQEDFDDLGLSPRHKKKEVDKNVWRAFFSRLERGSR